MILLNSRRGLAGRLPVLLAAAAFAVMGLPPAAGDPQPADPPMSDPHSALTPPKPGEAVDFNRDVRPILSAHCFKCHGPDENTREAGLRLDTFEAATEDYGGYSAVAPGDAAASEMIARITSSDPDVVMPPPHADKAISPQQLDTLRRWIDGGATYDRHWAFVPPTRPPLPEVSDGEWCRTPIDRFVLARLDAEGLTPVAEASREMLIRRVSLDLTGLPPTAAELEAFLADERPDAYERLVDRLLKSPHYGERWARRWLDVARYADTNGYEKDRPRSIWAYRDWVIDAINANTPYDTFTVKQLAGDMLPDATFEDRVATGFHRNTMINEEGGSDPLEYRFYAMVDRTNTTGTAWLGLTVGCTQCHTHKYDPITHTEYYGLMAFLDNADEPTVPLPDPEVAVKRAKAEAAIAKLAANRQAALYAAIAAEEAMPVAARKPRVWKKDRKAGVISSTAASRAASAPGASGAATRKGAGTLDGTSRLDRAKAHAETRFARWVEQMRPRATDWTPLEPTHVDAKLARFERMDDGSLLAMGDVQKEDWYELTFELPAGTTALRLEAIPDERLPAGGPGRVFYEGQPGDFMLSHLTARAGETDLPFAAASDTYSKTWLSKDSGAGLAIDEDRHTGWSISGRPGERHVAVFQFEQPVAPTPGVPGERGSEEREDSAGTPGVSPGDASEDGPGARLRGSRRDAGSADGTIPGDDPGVGDPPTVTVTVRMDFFRHYAATLGRFRWSATSEPDAAATTLTAAETVVLRKPVADWSEEDHAVARAAYLARAVELTDYNESIAKRRRNRPTPPTTLVMRERPDGYGRQTRRRHRGEYLSAEETVEPTVPAAVGQWPEGVPRNRLTLARWLVSEANPLAARVKMNRDWAAFFGTGIVKTLDDFGSQGDAPSHPELLDWLAVEFRETGWDVKAMHRLIVTSAVYRQTSEVEAGRIAADPDNRLLSRGPSRRLDAEEIRDAVLTAGGLLTRTLGGPSVYPPQPAVVAQENFYSSFQWDTATGPDRYRRGLYTFAKRTNPYAMFNTFDGPTGQVCVFARGQSNTPLQALTLLNDTVILEAARKLGRDLAAENASDEERAGVLFRRALSRRPDAAEAAAVAAFASHQRERLASGKLSATELMAGGATASEAAWYLAARAVLNTDEFIMKR